MTILAGDIGGTNSRLAFFASKDRRLDSIVEATCSSPGYSSLEAMVTEFMKRHNLRVSGAAFGVPGPVENNRCETTNLPWIVDARKLAEQLRIHSVTLINDIEATAYGIPTLNQGEIVELHAGRASASGNAAIVSVGTGLGEAGLYWDGTDWRPFATEGGHTSLAPADPNQDELLRYLRLELGHVSWERVLSGPGLFNIYRFLRDTGVDQEPDWLAEQIRQGDPAPLISEMALSGRCALCRRALDMFVVLLGAEAGNLTLKLMARGGVYLSGGIVPKIIQSLKDPAFHESFVAKGRMRPLLEATPVRVILNENVALRGAARHAMLQR